MLKDHLSPLPLIAVLRGIAPEEIPSIGDALFDAGFRILEVPLNSPRPYESIALLARRYAQRCLVGAGTVLDVAEVARVREAQGSLIVMPHGDTAIVREAKARGTLPFVTWSFTRQRDSDGTAWPDETEVTRYTVPIGITLTELVTMLRAKGLRIEMDASFVIHAWPEERENDLPGSIELEAGTNIREEVTREVKASRKKSFALVGGERRTGSAGATCTGG